MALIYAAVTLWDVMGVTAKGGGQSAPSVMEVSVI